MSHRIIESLLGAAALEQDSERRWAEAFSKSQDQLAVLADEALAELDRGETKPLSDLLTSDANMNDESRNQ